MQGWIIKFYKVIKTKPEGETRHKVSYMANECKNCGHEIVKENETVGWRHGLTNKQEEHLLDSIIVCYCGCREPKPKGD